MKHNRTFFLLILAGLTALTPQARSETVLQIPEKPATVQGFVRDSAKHPIAGATVSLRSKDKQALVVLTDVKGSYHFAAVRPAAYVLHAEMPGYHNAAVNLIVLGQKESTNIDLILDPANPSTSAPPAFFDEPHFTIAGVTDTTNLGGHGSDTIVRNRDALAKETASLHTPAEETSSNSIAEQHHRLAETNEKQGKPLEAVREFEQAAKLSPTEANLFDWGVELLLHHAAEPAIEVFTQGNRLFPHSARMLTALGAAGYAQGSYEKAVRHLCEASDLNPADPEPYLFMGKIEAAESAQLDAVAEKLARFARLQPENALANYYYAVSLWKRRSPDDTNFAQVQSLLEKAIHLDPKLGLAYLQLGILYSEQKDLTDAISTYSKAIVATPLLEQAHYRLAQAYKQTGEPSKAHDELQLYEHITEVKTEENERRRHELQQFIYQLRDATATAPPK